jgi:DNA-binding YbaB/EbfC family protein
MKFPGGGGGLGQMLGQAQRMQAEMKSLQDKLAKQEMELSSAGGRIKITINGKQEILALTLSADILDPKDPALVADLVKVAINEAIGHSQKVVASEMSKIIPPGLAGMF